MQNDNITSSVKACKTMMCLCASKMQ